MNLSDLDEIERQIINCAEDFEWSEVSPRLRDIARKLGAIIEAQRLEDLRPQATRPAGTPTAGPTSPRCVPLHAGGDLSNLLHATPDTPGAQYDHG